MDAANTTREKENPHRPFILRELKITIKALREDILSLVGVMLLLFFIIVGLLAPLLAPPTNANPYIMPIRNPSQSPFAPKPLPTPPDPRYLFGTLEGYDLFYGCVWGVRTAFQMGLLVVFGSLAIGLLVGSIAGYFGGLGDIIMMRFADIFFAFPAVLLAIVLVRALPSTAVLSLGFTNVQMAFSTMDKIVFVLVLIRWPFYARLIRSEIMKVKTEDYVEAARCIGCSNRRVLFKHILPNSIYPVLTMAFLDVGGIVLLATTLTFLGLGPPSGYAEWGSIINSSQRFIVGSLQDPLRYGYTFIFPAIFISAFVLAWSLVGDKLRETSDPAIRGRLG